MFCFTIQFCPFFILFVLCSASNAFEADEFNNLGVRAPDIICSAEEQHHPHDKYCDWYYECIDDKPVATRCPSGLHFSPALRVCVLPEFADCEIIATTTADPSTITDSTSEEESTPIEEETTPIEEETTTNEITTPEDITTTLEPIVETTAEPDTTTVITSEETTLVPETTVDTTTSESTVITSEETTLVPETTVDTTTSESTVITSEETTLVPETTVDTTTSESTTVESITTTVPTTTEGTTVTVTATTTSNVPTTTESTTVSTTDNDDGVPTSTPTPITTTTAEIPTTIEIEHDETITTPSDLYPTTPTHPTSQPTPPASECPPFLPINRICTNPTVRFYPHPYDCTKFVHCGNGKPFVFLCPGQLLWHQKYKTCDWPQNVKCCYGKEIFRCPPKKPLKYICNDGQLYQPHPTHCSRYVKCLNNQPYEQYCANGLLWNVRKEICDWPVNVQCCRYQI